MTEAAISRPRYDSNQSAMMSPYLDHQPGVLACRASVHQAGTAASSVTPYSLSRSVTSRSLNRTRPFSIRLILDRDARISYAACSGVMPAASTEPVQLDTHEHARHGRTLGVSSRRAVPLDRAHPSTPGADRI